MRDLEIFLKPTQKHLFHMLRKMFAAAKPFVSPEQFLLVKGNVPIMLVAHLDTVHNEPVRDICKTKDKNILMSPQGIGGDDRCGVYALVNAYEMSEKKPWLLFTCDEEVGGIGADFFCHMHQENKLPKGLDALKLLIEIDRRGSNDAVYYDCDNSDFEKYITGKGFKTAFGSFSDISVIAPELGVAAVNLSSGYYNAHTLHEYINRAELDDVVRRVVDIISDVAAADFPRYKYVKKTYAARIWKSDYYDGLRFGDVIRTSKEYVHELEVEPEDDLPEEYEELYEELMDYFGYTVEELENFRESYGNRIIYDLYVESTKPFYRECDDGSIVTAVPEK